MSANSPPMAACAASPASSDRSRPSRAPEGRARPLILRPPFLCQRGKGVFFSQRPPVIVPLPQEGRGTGLGCPGATYGVGEDAGVAGVAVAVPLESRSISKISVEL